MTYKNTDMKNFRAKHETIKHQVFAFIWLIVFFSSIIFAANYINSNEYEQKVEKIKCV